MKTLAQGAAEPVAATPPKPRMAGGAPPLISIVIVNFNYGRYLERCIESALAQDYPRAEVIVVDDGSTDGSRAVIESFGRRVTPLFKSNGGMASAVNLGFSASRGEILVFLDADDFLLEGALSRHAEALSDVRTVRSQGYLAVVGAEGSPLGGRIPSCPAPAGDLSEAVLDHGPGAYVSAPNSGNAWSRRFLEKVFPLPETTRGVGAEPFLMDTAPLFGVTATTEETIAAYRMHGANMSGRATGLTFDNMAQILESYRIRAERLAAAAASLGHEAAAARWLARNWRLLTLRHLHARLSGVGDGPGWRDHTRASWSVRGNPMKRAAVLAAVLAIRAAPTPVALALASHLIKLRYM